MKYLLLLLINFLGINFAVAKVLSDQSLIAVEKLGKVAFFLPEAHTGSPAQFGLYFREVVKPAFAVSNVLFHEGALLPAEDPSFWNLYCKNESPFEEIDNDLNDALNRQFSKGYENPFETVGDIQKIGRFVRFFYLLLPTTSTKLLSGQRKTRTTPSLSYQLVREFNIHKKSIENTNTLFDAYCELSSIERDELIESIIKDDIKVQKYIESEKNGYNDISSRSIEIEIDKTYLSTLKKIQSQINNSSEHYSLNKVEDKRLSIARRKYLIHQRNIAWMPRLASILSEERLPSFVIGANHFVDGAYGSGLISLLRKDGYKVTLVKNKQHLDDILAAYPAKIQVDSIKNERNLKLEGHCKRVLSLYTCAWGSGDTLLVVNSIMKPDKEAVTFCYRRRGGSKCETFEVPRASWRDIDLLNAKEIEPD